MSSGRLQQLRRARNYPDSYTGSLTLIRHIGKLQHGLRDYRDARPVNVLAIMSKPREPRAAVEVSTGSVSLASTVVGQTILLRVQSGEYNKNGP